MKINPATPNVLEHAIVNPGKASWERFSSAGSHQCIRLTGHLVSRWLNVHLTEHGEKSSKETMITLDEKQVKELHEMTGRVLGINQS